MILDEFIDKLFNRYKCTAPIPDDKKREFTDILITKCEKIDFQKLLEIIAREHDSDFIPSVSRVLDWSSYCYKTEYKRNAGRVKQVAFQNTQTGYITRNDAFEGEISEEALLKWKAKKTGHNNWRIVEVY